MNILLSVLICTMKGREKMLESMLNSLVAPAASYEYNVARTEFICNYRGLFYEIRVDGGKETTGFKRNRLIHEARGDYVAFVDDDDRIDAAYIHVIMAALYERPDAVGFKGWITFDGRKRMEWRISKNFPYETRGNIFFRYNNHLSPIKREIAVQVGYPDQVHEEDFVYAKKLHDLGLVKTETFINKFLYHYDYKTKK